MIRSNIILLIIAVVVIISIPAVAAAPLSATEAAQKYNEAGALYRSGSFSEALEKYISLIEAGIENPDLFYNASNAAYRSEKLGLAILYLERARNLSPSDADIKSNLAYLNSIKVDSEPENPNAVTAFIIEKYDAIDTNAAAWWSLLSFIAGMSLLAAALFSTDWKKIAFFSASALFILFFGASTIILIQKVHHESTVTEAVIMSDEAPAFSGPGTDNTHIFTLHEGTKVTIERSQDGWNLIRLKSGAGGWIQMGSMDTI